MHLSKAMKKVKKRDISDRGSPITTTGFYILKWIACITMVIDHVALFFQSQCEISPAVYLIMRGIGRTAFPLFAYLLVEGFYHTENRGKHLLRIGILALVSEIPFDIINISQLSADENILSFSHQNVCISFFISYLLLMITDTEFSRVKKLYNNSKFGKLIEANAKIVLWGIAMATAYFLNVDYDFSGVFFVFLLNLARDKKYKWVIQLLAFVFLGISGGHYLHLLLVIPFILIILAEHKGKKETEQGNALFRFVRSKFSRRLTGIFYPLHMVILIIIRAVMVLV